MVPAVNIEETKISTVDAYQDFRNREAGKLHIEWEWNSDLYASLKTY